MRKEGKLDTFILLTTDHFSDDPPEPQEVFTVVQVSETKIALRTAFGRYVSVSTSGELEGRAEAMGPREQWEPVFEDVCEFIMSISVGITLLLPRVMLLCVLALIGFSQSLVTVE